VIGSKQDMLGVLCWLASGSILNALKREIEAQPPPVNAMPAAERIAKISSLEAKLLDLERKESALLDDTIIPRPEMNPLAYLRIAVVAKEVAASAA
jgi:hypothetical protein